MLRYRADLRTLFFLGLYFANLVFLWNWLPAGFEGFAFTGPALALFGLYPLLLMTSFQGAVSTHNGVHTPMFKQRWLNRVWQIVLTLSYGHPVSSYVPGHNLSHHKHTQSRKDVMRTTKARFRWNLLNGLFFVALIAPSIMKADAAYAKRMKTRHPKWHRQLQYEIIVLWSLNIGLFILDWRKGLILWLIPHLYAQWGIVTMNLIQHDGCDEHSEYNHSRNFVGKLVNFFVFNNGYHSVHHLKPGLHWSLTPAAHAELIAPHIHPNLDQQNFVGYLFRTYFLNKRETYDGKPYTPPAAGEDELWIPDPRETMEDLGAVTLEGNEEFQQAIAG